MIHLRCHVTASFILLSTWNKTEILFAIVQFITICSLHELCHLLLDCPTPEYLRRAIFYSTVSGSDLRVWVVLYLKEFFRTFIAFYLYNKEAT